MATTSGSATAIRAAVLDRPGVPTRTETLDLDPPGEGEVRVRMVASGVCHSDLHVRDGEWERAGPIVLGHEGAAIVEELGAGVAERRPDLHAGDLVALAWLIPCGRCRACRAGHVWLCSSSPSYTHRMPSGRAAIHRPNGAGDVLTYSAIGTFADRQNVPAAAAIPVDPATPHEIAALIGCCVTTGVGAMTKTADVRPGARVAVIGLGGVGLSCVMGAALAGAGQIVAIDRIQAKLDLARSVGATDTILAGHDDAETLGALRELTDGGPDVCAEAIGLPRTIELAIASLPTGGTAVLVGMTPFGTRASFEAFPFVDGGRRILGSNYGSADPAVDFARYAQLHLAGRLPADRLVTGRIGLDGLEDAFAAMRRGEGVRTMIAFD
ncbi:MAG TPA: alcohol dehydrogenase catalytic domain-containing protein [Candidatus Limnocylindrales bacterium]|nr:alcohol dehydrogenase catalytic domain-containing protein [Candidatus Limnocylindrales bacterium]